MDNPYNILGITPTATNDEIKKAYRALAMRHHPDRSTQPGTENRFNAINAAYELLSDPKRRAAFNQTLNNRIILDAHAEAASLWQSLFNRYGMMPK